MCAGKQAAAAAAATTNDDACKHISSFSKCFPEDLAKPSRTSKTELATDNGSAIPVGERAAATLPAGQSSEPMSWHRVLGLSPKRFFSFLHLKAPL